MGWVLLWLGLAVAAGVIAASKGRSGFGYFVLGFFLPLIGVLIAIGVPRLDPEPARPAAPGDLVYCRSCRQPHVAGLAACPHCSARTAPPRPPALKKCPVCAEQIQPEAIKCRFCGADQAPPPGLAVAPFMGYCAGCGKLRGDNVAKCLYCGDTAPVTATPPKISRPA